MASAILINAFPKSTVFWGDGTCNEDYMGRLWKLTYGYAQVGFVVTLAPS